MSKSKKERSDWVITKGQLARWQKEQQRQRRIIIIGSIVIAVVIALIIYAIYDAAKPNSPIVLKVTGPQGERSFDRDYYIDMMRLYGIRAVTSSEELSSKASSTLQAMEINEIFRQLATELNISVAEEEIQARIIENFTPPVGTGTNAPANPATPTYEESIAMFSQSFVYNGVSLNQYREVIATEILGNKVQDYISKRDVPDEVEQVNFQGIQIDTAPVPVSTGTSIFIENPGTSTQNVDLQEIYQEIKTRLAAGEDFYALAEEFSISVDAAVLEWYPRDIIAMFYGEAVAEAVFTLGLDTLSGPVPSNSAEDNTKYWILRVHQREVRPLEESYRQFMETMAFNEWFEQEGLKFSSEIKIDDEGIREAVDKALS